MPNFGWMVPQAIELAVLEVLQAAEKVVQVVQLVLGKVEVVLELVLRSSANPVGS